MASIKLECWSCEAPSPKQTTGKVKESTKVEKPYSMGVYLGSSYRYTFVRVDTKDLVITEMKRFTGGILDTIAVFGVVDLASKCPYPLYVRESVLQQLRTLIVVDPNEPLLK